MAEEQTQKKKRPTAEKRHLQDERKRVHRKSFRSRISSAIRAYKNALKETPDEAKNKLNVAYSLLDKAVKKKIFKKNKAARTKSKLSNHS